MSSFGDCRLLCWSGGSLSLAVHVLTWRLPPSLLVWGLSVLGCACPHLETAAFFCLWLCMSPLEDCHLLCWSGGSLSLAVHVPTWRLPPSLLVWGLSVFGCACSHLETAASCLWLCMSPLEDCRLLCWSGGSLLWLTDAFLIGLCSLLQG
jgi:hypothetical protein